MQAQNEIKTNFNLLDDLFIPPKEEPKQEDEDVKKYIIHAKQIDTHSIKRTRVELTPAVCDKCGLDLCNLAYEQNKLSTNVFDELPEEVKLLMPQLVIKHKQAVHTSADDLIVTQKPKQWLSGQTR